VPGVLIVRPDAQLYYANARTTRDRVMALIAEREVPPRAVIFDAASQDEIDITSTDIVRGLVQDLHSRGIDVYFVAVHAPVLDRGLRAGLIDAVGQDHVLPTVDAAVQRVEATAEQHAGPGG
jgi:MFS superfamily sulfate permease-like transporter